MKTLHIIIAFCAGLLFGYLFLNLERNNVISDTGVSTSLKKAGQVDSVKVIRDTVFQIRNRQLENQLQIANTNLLVSQSRLQEQKEQLLILTKKLTHKETVLDTVFVDSLKAGIEKLTFATDSIVMAYENKLLVMEAGTALRDSQLIFCDSSYRQMKSIVQEQALREAKLVGDLKSLIKQQKQKRWKNKALALGMLFISGVGTSLIIKSRQ